MLSVMFTMNTVECSEHYEAPNNWPFPFPANTGAVTTKFVMNGEQPIVEVLHWDDGGWQFMCNTTDDADDGMVVCMGCLYKKFPWISKFKSLAPNHSAYLENSSWQIEELE
jgi:hypothetical protein